MGDLFLLIEEAQHKYKLSLIKKSSAGEDGEGKICHLAPEKRN
jgi:hypothetical protein